MARAAHLRLESGERRMLVIRRHWWVLLRPLLGIGPLLAVLPAYAGVEYAMPEADLARYTGIFLVVDLALISILCLKWLANDFAVWYADAYIITSRRIIEMRGIVTVERREANLRTMQESNYSIAGAQARFFDYGDLTIQTGGRGGNMVFRQVPHPRRIQSVLAQHAQAARDEHQLLRGGKNQIDAALRRVFGGEAPLHEARTEELPRITKAAVRVQRRITLLPDETVVYVTRQHPLRLLMAWFPALVLVAAAVAQAILAPALLVPPLAYAGLGILIAGWVVWSLLDWQDDQYVITTERLMELRRTPLFFELRNVVQLRAVQDVVLRISTISGRLFNLGTLTVELSGSADPLRVISVPHPDRFQRLIFEQLDEAVQRDRLREQERLAGTLGDWFEAYHRMQEETAP